MVNYYLSSSLANTILLTAVLLSLPILVKTQPQNQQGGVDFTTSSSAKCLSDCVENNLQFFLAMDESVGRCCDLTTHAIQGCSMGGASSLDILYKYRHSDLAGSLLCPKEQFCGERLMIARDET